MIAAAEHTQKPICRRVMQRVSRHARLRVGTKSRRHHFLPRDRDGRRAAAPSRGHSLFGGNKNWLSAGRRLPANSGALPCCLHVRNRYRSESACLLAEGNPQRPALYSILELVLVTELCGGVGAWMVGANLQAMLGCNAIAIGPIERAFQPIEIEAVSVGDKSAPRKRDMELDDGLNSLSQRLGNQAELRPFRIPRSLQNPTEQVVSV